MRGHGGVRRGMLREYEGAWGCEKGSVRGHGGVRRGMVRECEGAWGCEKGYGEGV